MRQDGEHRRAHRQPEPVVDTHAHLASEAFDSDRDEVIARASEAGVAAIVVPASGLAESRAAVALAEANSMVYAAVGVHPHDATSLEADGIQELRRLAMHPRVVAIGEIGLDFYRDYAPHDAQRGTYQAQLALARQVDKPVIIHDREAHREVLSTLRQWAGDSRVPPHHEPYTGDEDPVGVLHCFSGNLEMAREAIRLGFYIGVDGPVTYRRASRLRKLVRQLPLDRLLIETDCPYLTPEPHRGQRNEPAYVRFVAQVIAEVRGLPFEEVARATTANARRLFGLPGG